MDTKIKKRDVYLDFIKGIAAFLVLWGHVIQYCTLDESFFDNPVFKLIYGFHMPIFMIISGYFFNNTLKKYSGKWLGFFLNQFRSIIYPVLVWGTLSGVYYVIRNGMGILTLWNIVAWYRSFWFLICLIICSFIVFIVESLVKHKIRVLLYVLVFVGLCFLPEGDTIPFMFPYFMVGFTIYKFKEKILLNKRAVNIVGIVSFVIYLIMMYFLYTREVYIYVSGLNPLRSSYGFFEQTIYNIIRWLVGFIGSYGIATITYLCYKKSKFLCGYISHLGQISLQIYVVQHLLLEIIFRNIYISICNNVGYSILQTNMVLFNFVYSILIAVVFSIIILLFTMCLNKLKISKVFFGR